ncbi:hypothetical protein [Streptomyces sp. NBC_00576]|uniref:hypothetical protein n=1 Tax=Streptomyces sp. NBC_00576 TaxID=2903665 RepID=UPI002E821492|nr:hypothetical protein [Streptomyces sp. NBC_00576]WUB76983.1 hypothetical protein OG734_47005 [Streptomyces sp. NBC_00576]
MQPVAVTGSPLQAAFEPLAVPGEFVDAFAHVPGAEGVELLSALVLDSPPHPVSVYPQDPDLLPGQLEFRAQHRSGAASASGRGNGGVLALLRALDALADTSGAGKPCGDADGTGDRSVSDLLALLFQDGECGQGSLAFVDVVTPGCAIICWRRLHNRLC